MDILDKAIVFAVEAHSGGVRKGTKKPYITHPLEAMVIVATMTDDREMMTAAVLHDVVEDTAFTIEDIRSRFGDRVADLVGAESEDKREDIPAADSWEIRKKETIEHLKHAGLEEKMITLGDKLSNIRAMYRDYLAIGDKLWERFNQKDKNKQGWYYKAVAEELADLKEYPSYREYCELVGKVFGE